MSRSSLSLLLPALLLFTGACKPADAGGSTTALEGAALKRRTATLVRVSPARLQEMVRITSTTTNVESVNEIQVFPRSVGVVTEIRVEEGDRVEQGESLALIDPRDAQAALSDAEIALQEARDATPRLELALKEAEQRVARAKLAWEQSAREVKRNEEAGLLSAVDMDKLRTARDTAEHDVLALELAAQGSAQELGRQATVIERAVLAVERMQLALSHTQILAPFGGVIAARTIRAGDSASSASPAFTLTDPDNVRAVVYRPQRELGFFQSTEDLSAIEVRVQPEALPDRQFQGSIAFLSPTIDATSGSFRVTIDLAQPSDGIRLAPGMLVRIDIITERETRALCVPKRALRREGDKQFVFCARSGKAVKLQVEEKLSDDEWVQVQVLEGGSLEAGEPIIVVGNRELEGGEEVAIRSEDEDSPHHEETGEAAVDDSPGAQDSPTRTGQDN